MNVTKNTSGLWAIGGKSGSVIFKPGDNSIADNIWNEIFKRPAIQEKCNSGEFVVTQEPVKTTATLVDYANLNSKEAIATVDLVENTDQLNLYYHLEMGGKNRSTVLSAMYERANELGVSFDGDESV